MQEDVLNGLTREELMELVRMFGKNLVAMDGVWFQSVERAAGMDAAMAHDRAIWAQFSRIEARRIKQSHFSISYIQDFVKDVIPEEFLDL